MSSTDSVLLSTSSSESVESRRSGGRQVDEECTSSGGMVSGIPLETVRQVREDPLEELAESNWPAKGGYEWVAVDVRNQSSLFRWSRLLNSWLNCTPVITKGISGSIVSLERVSSIDRVCHGQEGATEKYIYMCHFSQLDVRLPLDDFTMGVLRALDVTLRRPSISRLDAFSQSFKHFKDGYFKVVVKEEGHMVQSGKKNLALFQSLRKEMATKAKAVGKTDVPNLQESVVEVHVHGGMKRKAELPPHPDKGKEVKKVRAALLGAVSASRAGSASEVKGPESGLIELPEISVRKYIAINLPDTIINSIDGMEGLYIGGR
ncbi:hypothetical protein DEO72_LG8g2607 [Vigna unguiculata]|uniref:Uncharacterized protein n=1 Tax=Vigna unguiculata TaxID=3917 RepID=A0A4D6MVA1_VIGUN|nr:hypothetical protein DEO72_LG8g2607 [Vigna unguiculata]